MAGDSMGGGMGGRQTRAADPGEAPFVPLGQLAHIETVLGPPMIKSEMGSLTGWVYIDIADRDVGGYVDDAKAGVARTVKLPPGYSLKWTGQYELLERVRARMAFILPLTLALVFGVPFAAVGAVWLSYFGHRSTPRSARLPLAASSVALDSRPGGAP